MFVIDVLGWQLLVYSSTVALTPFLCIATVPQEHMDPSEIIATSFPLENVISFTMFPVVITMIFWLVKAPQNFTSNMISLAKLSLIVYALFALCGDNMVKNWKHSMASAVYIGTLVSSTSNGKATSKILEELPFSDFSDILAPMRLYGMLVFSIPFQILSVLDRGIQMQRWPLPILFGS